MIKNVYCTVKTAEDAFKIVQVAKEYEVEIHNYELKNSISKIREHYDWTPILIVINHHGVCCFIENENGLRHLAYSNFIHNLKLNKAEPQANENEITFVLPEINVLYECYETEIKIFPKHGMKFFFKKDKCIVIEKIAPEAKPLKKYITLWCEKNNAKFNFNYKKILDTAFTNFGDNGFLKELNKFQCLEILQLIADEKNKDKERLITHHIAFNPVRKKIDIIQLDYIYFDVEFYDRKDAEFVLKNYKELLNKINS
jgi:hypothetical protein